MNATRKDLVISISLILIGCVIAMVMAPTTRAETATATLTVVVVDLQGDPIPGAMVVASDAGGQQVYQALSDGNGTALLPLTYVVGEAQGTEYSIVADAVDYYMRGDAIVIFFDGPRMLPLTLTPGDNTTPLPLVAVVVALGAVVGVVAVRRRA